MLRRRQATTNTTTAAITARNGPSTTTNLPGQPVEWDMGGEAFVPASSHRADGYYQPVTDPEWSEFQKGGTR